MKYYFSLQYNMLNRRLRDWGISPILAYPLALLVFIALSVYLFTKGVYVSWIYVLFALIYIAQLSERQRNRFLQTCFVEQEYQKIRVLENLLLALPFMGILAFYQQFLAIGVLVCTAIVLALFNFGNRLQMTVPSPFYHLPFEFTEGFRYSFGGHLLVYTLAIIAISVGNFMMGGLALAFVFLICMVYYNQIETPHLVWIFKQNPHQFLWQKIKIAFLYSSLLSLPMVLLLACFFSEHILSLLLIMGMGYLYLIGAILAKYVAFPQKINFTYSLLFAFSILFPPLLLVVLPFFYIKSIRQLKPILS